MSRSGGRRDHNVSERAVWRASAEVTPSRGSECPALRVHEGIIGGTGCRRGIAAALRGGNINQKPVSVGGPSTITGVLYQALVALASCAELSILSCGQSGDPAGVSEFTLVLEPPTGGDQTIDRGSHRIVEQVKTRSVGTWSLQDFIKDVLPDLYRSVDLRRPTRYRFTTNGEIGNWSKVLEFFQSLAARERGPAPWLRLRTDRPLLPVGRGSSAASAFWKSNAYSEQELFDRIVDHVRADPCTGDDSLDTCREKVWHVLESLEIQEPRDFGALQKQIDAWLTSRIDSIDDLPAKRDSLLADLLRRAAAGSAHITPGKFFEYHRLDAAPLEAWSQHVDRARAMLASHTEKRGYRSTRDARPADGAKVAAHWHGSSKILVLRGDSGTGKSWLAWSIFHWLATQGELVIAIDALGDAFRDLDVAASRICRRILDHDDEISLDRLRARIRRVNPELSHQPIYILVDGLQNIEEARHLVFEPLEDWAVKLAVTDSGDVLSDLIASDESRFQVVTVEDFTLEQLERYLEHTLGDH